MRVRPWLEFQRTSDPRPPHDLASRFGRHDLRVSDRLEMRSVLQAQAPKHVNLDRYSVSLWQTETPPKRSAPLSAVQPVRFLLFNDHPHLAERPHGPNQRSEMLLARLRSDLGQRHCFAAA